MRVSPLVAAALLCGALVAHADTLITFNAFDGTTNDPSGSITLDLTNNSVFSGTVAGFDVAGLNLQDGGAQLIDEETYQFFSALFYIGAFSGDATAQEQGTYSFFDNSPVPPNPIIASGGGYFQEVGYTAPTPEPSSLLLLTTGLTATALVLRKRIFKPRQATQL